MIAARRILAVAVLRVREGTRGALLPILLAFLAAAALATLLVPGEPGLDRQRAVDALVLDLVLILSVVGAAALGAAALAGDRDAGREALLRARPLGRLPLLCGGLLGNGAVLLALLAGMYLGTISITGLLAGGDRDRTPTKVALRADDLLDSAGEPVRSGLIGLTRTSPAATYVLPARREEFPALETRVRIFVMEVVDELGAGLPAVYPVGVKVGDGPETILQKRRGNPVVLDVPREEIRAEGLTSFTIRRIDPAFTLGLSPGGLTAEGPERPYFLNLGSALLGWFLALLVLAAAAQAFSTVVGAPVAAAGTLLFALLGRSLGFMSEALGYASHNEHPISPAAQWFAEAAIAVLPDFTAFDLARPVTARWAIPDGELLSLGLAALPAIAFFVALGWLLLALRGRR